MRKLWVTLICLAAAACPAQTLSKWNGVTIGTSTGNISALNGKTIGASTGNYGKWNGVTLPGTALPAPTVVQSVSTGNGGAVASVAMPSNVTVGNILVAAMFTGAAINDPSTFTDNLGNTATLLASSNLTADGDTVSIVCAPITTGGADTITFRTLGGSPTNQRVVMYEVHSSAHTLTCTQDVTAVSANTTATACSSGPMTTSTANDFLVAICGMDGTQTSSVAAGSGWSGGLNAGSGGGTSFNMMSEYRIGTSAGSFTATSGAIASQEQGTLLVALKP